MERQQKRSPCPPPIVDYQEDEETGEGFNCNLPPEIWREIFKLAKPQEPKHLSKLRLVCKKWRNVIDEHFDLKIKINDNKMDASSIKQFRKVTHCIVSKFVREVDHHHQQLFKNPKLLTCLTIRGPITRRNFGLIASQCDAVTEFTFTGSILIKEANIFNVPQIEQFTSSLKKLVMTCIWINIWGQTENLTEENLISLLKCPMPNLTSLTIRAVYLKRFDDNQLVSFVKRCANLKNLELTLRNFDGPNQGSIQLTSSVSMPTLATVKIECIQGYLFKPWLPLLRAQTSLRSFHLVVGSSKNGELEVNSEIEEILLKNQKSLEYLEMAEIVRGPSLNVEHLFQGMVNLKTLKLRVMKGGLMRFRNLRLLPASIKTLELVNFAREM